ncbi:uncharacterized protein N7477_006532 [Penicillium maclennaniae]|uniref:uncharacterized protein n=1 Tax=Penicillium maclennaniae TaxID=1343394 RepID=UPI0025401665|nr:uncharacterized protein N7477_006532 [Penicillium maclennaniae]KAJ5667962.1 hypothetical protein N7477_006532 [Penicillium maclennaniae]
MSEREASEEGGYRLRAVKTLSRWWTGVSAGFLDFLLLRETVGWERRGTNNVRLGQGRMDAPKMPKNWDLLSLPNSNPFRAKAIGNWAESESQKVARARFRGRDELLNGGRLASGTAWENPDQTRDYF